MRIKTTIQKNIPKPFPDKWASGYGEDEYGIWQSFTVNGICCCLRWINAGTFLMGSPESEVERSFDETQYEVTISKGYWLAETVCTQELWQLIMVGIPRDFKVKNLPIETVSWYNCQLFLQKLNEQKPGLDLRLPTEAEWEYACRAGTETPFSFGEKINTDQANYNGTYPYPYFDKNKERFRQTTVEVKSLPCNDWGLYEMHGNVWEWCNDWYDQYPYEAEVDPAGPDTGFRRVLRGGSWYSSARSCRSAFRHRFEPGGRDRVVSFRFARSQNEKESGKITRNIIMSSSNSFFEDKRTWSRIKDEVLKTYLAPYLAKISKTKRPIIVADCFAGKGRFDNGEPGSPLIIAEAISHQLDDSPSPAIKGVFIEKKYFGNLKANIPDSHWLYPLEGDYEERMEFFVKKYEPRDQNLFLYVDPYGIKSVLFSHFEKIQQKGFRTVELLLNLNSFGFMREACRLLKYPVQETESPDVYEQDINTPERLDEIAGGNYWREIIDKYYSHQIKMAEAEELFIAQYCERLRKIFRYVVNIPIKAKLSNIPKYRIIFGTDHDDGLLLMVDNMNKRWAAFREEARDNQSLLFECDFPDPSKQQASWNVEKKMFSLIDKDIELKELLVRLVQEFGINFSTSEFKQYLKQMENDKIDVKRFPAMTPTGKPSTSWDHTRSDFTVTISRRAQWQPPLL